MWKVGFYLSCVAVARSFSSLPSCSSDEAELAGKRVQTLLALNSVFTSFGALDVFSLESFISELGPLVTPEFTTTVPYGGGTYAGLNDAAEYLALQFPSVNVGGSSFNGSDTGGVLPAVSIDGDAYTTKSNFAANFFPTVNPSLRLPIQSEVVVTFAPCSEKIALYRGVPNPSFGDWIRAMSWGAIHSTYQGVFDVCAYHEKYCTGEYEQYDDFTSCVAYLTALPDVPVGCPWAPLAGSSKVCKSKHKLLVPFQAKHCYHMGPLTRADGTPNYDPDGQLKCSDAEECPAHPKTDFVLGEPTGEFLDAMNAYDAAIATAYHNPITNFSLDHYKFPNVAAAR